MVKNHLKRIAAPKSWLIRRKGTPFITRPRSSGHSMRMMLPIAVVLRDILGLSERRKEVSRVLQHEQVLINGRRTLDKRAGIGFMDTLEISKANVRRRVSLDRKGRLSLIEIDEKETKIRPAKIIGKTMLQKGKIQAHLMGGYNILVEKDSLKVGDTVLLEVPSLQVKDHFSLAKGAALILTAGKHAGDQGIIEDIAAQHLIYKNKANQSIQTLKKYAFVIGKNKPMVKL